jgi:GTPase SAR1 family protein
MLDLDVSNGRCLGVLTDEFWVQPLEYQREFFLLSFLMILRPHGRYGLHANALTNHQVGYLVVGAASSGKTTLSLTLIREGWGFLSDDALMLHKTPRGIEALALRRGFSCTVQTTSRFPELEASVDEAPAFLDGKKLVDIDRGYPQSFSLRCFPRVLLFPTITNKTRSRLIQSDPTQSMVALLQQSPGIMTDRPWVIQQLDVLRQLVKQSRSYQLMLGTDVYDAPQAVAEMLSSVPVD